MEQTKEKVELSFRRGKVCGFLEDLMKLCVKHEVSIVKDEIRTVVLFHNWDHFIKLEVDFEGASLYWPRIQTEIVVRRKNEKPSEVVSNTKATNRT